MSDPYLIAHAVNAISPDSARVEFEIASPTPADEWYTNDGIRVYPFWTIPLDALMHDTDVSPNEIVPERTLDTVPPIPPGWIEHLHRLADRSAAGRLSPRVSILALLPQAARAYIRRRL